MTSKAQRAASSIRQASTPTGRPRLPGGCDAGVAKADLATTPLVMLGLLAGVFIGFGAFLQALVLTGAGDPFGPVRLLGGVAFSVGLVLVIVGGAELFTGNALLVMAWISDLVTGRALARN